MPTDSFLPAFANVSLTTILTWVWLALLVGFLVHWVVASYHWYTFGSSRRISLLSISLYGAAGLLVLLMMGGILLTL